MSELSLFTTATVPDMDTVLQSSIYGIASQMNLLLSTAFLARATYISLEVFYSLFEKISYGIRPLLRQRPKNRIPFPLH